MFGLFRAKPDDVAVAWGARLITEDGGGLDFVYDRQSAVGDTELANALCDRINDLKVMNDVRAAWKRVYRKAEPSGEDVVLYDRNGLRCIGSSQRSFGYLYIVIYEVPR